MFQKTGPLSIFISACLAPLKLITSITWLLRIFDYSLSLGNNFCTLPEKISCSHNQKVEQKSLKMLLRELLHPVFSQPLSPRSVLVEVD